MTLETIKTFVNPTSKEGLYFGWLLYIVGQEVSASRLHCGQMDSLCQRVFFIERLARLHCSAVGLESHNYTR